jgi:hypothetical protein
MSQPVSALLAVSAGLFGLEIFLFLWIQSKLNEDFPKEELLLAVSESISKIKPEHILIYALGYSLVLYLSVVFPILFTLLITYQLFSVAFDVYILVKASRPR